MSERMPQDPRDADPDAGDWECPHCRVRFTAEDDRRIPLADRLLMHGWGCPEHRKGLEYLAYREGR